MQGRQSEYGRHTATCCNTLCYTCNNPAPYCTTLHHAAPHCNTLQHNAPDCTTLHSTCNTPTTHLDTLQHTCFQLHSRCTIPATHLQQHTATHLLSAAHSRKGGRTSASATLSTPPRISTDNSACTAAAALPGSPRSAAISDGTTLCVLQCVAACCSVLHSVVVSRLTWHT